MINKLYERIKKFIKENYLFLLILMIIGFVCFYETPYVVYRPGGTINLKDRIVIDEDYKETGSLSMAYVTMSKGNIPILLLSFILPNWDLEKTSSITLENESIDDTIKRDRLSLENGLDNAIISAYTMADKPIEIINTKHLVTYIDSSANTNLEIGDTLISIDDKDVTSLSDLQNYINNLNKGDVVNFKVLRDNKEKNCTATVYEIEGSLKVGIAIIDRYEYKTDPKIEIKTESSESGSSGGLMTALSIYNALTVEDITKGRNIVGTGTIDSQGNVGEIGGVKYKLLGAEKEGADIFLCPKENYQEALEIKQENDLKLDIISVSTLSEAIDLLN